MVPVMLMGYVVSRRVHTAFEYFVALAVTCGVMIFKLYETNDAPVKNTEVYGVMLIIVYMGTDSFTSNWQSKVFKQYKVSSTAMMLYANLFSSAFTALGLVVTLEISHVYEYLLHNPTCVLHIFVMAICSAVGQLFIFYTVKTYVPLVFATIQTVRQFLSVIFSILFFAHAINSMMAFGIFVVFAALGAQIFDKWRARSRSSKKPLPPTPPTEMVCIARPWPAKTQPGADATKREPHPHCNPGDARWQRARVELRIRQPQGVAAAPVCVGRSARLDLSSRKTSRRPLLARDSI